MAKRNARGSDPTWAALAYHLWRRKHLTNREIARHLAAEGWDASPAEIEDVVGLRVQDELRRFTESRRGL